MKLMLISKKEPYRTNKSFKFFIGYNDNDEIRPLCIKLLRMIGFVKCFKNNNNNKYYYYYYKTMFFKVADKKLWKKYTKIWKKVSSLMNKKFDSEPVYGDHDEYIKTKIETYGDKQIQIFKVKIYQKKKLHVNVFH